MEALENICIEEVEITDDNKILINDGEYEIALHPNMPKRIIEKYLQLTFDDGATKSKLVLSITDRCNLACDFCCHPYMDSEFSEVDAIRIVNEACKFGEFSEICLTGGEPFLRYKLIIKLAKICRDHNTLFGVITNGFWGDDEPGKKCKELLESGVGRVSFSWDPSHGKFVSSDTMMRCIDSAMDAGLKVNLTGSFKKPDDTHENYGFDLSKHKKYANFVQSTHNVVQAGRGTKLRDLYRESLDQDSINQFRCPAIVKGNDMTLYSMNGLSMPCCSVFSGYNLFQLSIGDWRESSIEELYLNHITDGYYRIINDFGFNYFFEVVESVNPELYKKLPCMSECTSSCELCSKLAVMDEFPLIRKICNEHIDMLILNKVEHIFSQAT